MRVSLMAIVMVAGAVALMALIWRPRAGPSTRGARPSRPATQVSPAPATAVLPERPPVAGERVVLVRKADRVLGLYLHGRRSATYPIALGRQPEGHKQRQGDGRTPEGEYYICNRNPRSQFHLFLGLSYPNAQDAEAAHRRHLITKQARDRIVEAIAARRQPPWDTPLGGEIGLHGNGVGTDWTLGCIALEDEAIEELWGTLRVGDPVVVEP
jgi:murein L,D-transpeptidase YafK